MIDGEVRDGSRRPLQGAVVRIVGSDLRAVTDADGRYTLRDVPPGLQFVVVDHGSLADLGVRAGEGQVLLDDGARREVSFNAPAISEIISTLCDGQDIPRNRATVRLTLTDSLTERPLSGVRLRVDREGRPQLRVRRRNRCWWCRGLLRCARRPPAHRHGIRQGQDRRADVAPRSGGWSRDPPQVALSTRSNGREHACRELIMLPMEGGNPVSRIHHLRHHRVRPGGDDLFSRPNREVRAGVPLRCPFSDLLHRWGPTRRWTEGRPPGRDAARPPEKR